MLTPDEITQIENCRPIHIKVFYAKGCPMCPEVIKSLQTLSDMCRTIHLKKVDAGKSVDAAEIERVRSVPTTILEDEFRWVGAFDIKELIQMILNPGHMNLGVDSLQNMLEAGDAEELAQLMCKQNKVFPKFIDLIIHEKWPVRLGAMVTVEYIADENKDLAIQIADQLWQRFWTQPDPIKGDIIHIFSLLKGAKVNAYIEYILSKIEDGEVKEAAQEAFYST